MSNKVKDLLYPVLLDGPQRTPGGLFGCHHLSSWHRFVIIDPGQGTTQQRTILYHLTLALTWPANTASVLEMCSWRCSGLHARTVFLDCKGNLPCKVAECLLYNRKEQDVKTLLCPSLLKNLRWETLYKDIRAIMPLTRFQNLRILQRVAGRGESDKGSLTIILYYLFCTARPPTHKFPRLFSR